LDGIDMLKSMRSVCNGNSNLSERLANSSGLETVAISGYAKGHGHTPGIQFSDPTNRAWNAVKIDKREMEISVHEICSRREMTAAHPRS
jgi:transglutaminase/protease-like cytokinesis protein 3